MLLLEQFSPAIFEALSPTFDLDSAWCLDSTLDLDPGPRHWAWTSGLGFGPRPWTSTLELHLAPRPQASTLELDLAPRPDFGVDVDVDIDIAIDVDVDN